MAWSPSVISPGFDYNAGRSARPQPPYEAGIIVIHVGQKSKPRHRDIKQVNGRAGVGIPVCLIPEPVLFHYLTLPLTTICHLLGLSVDSGVQL